MKTWVAWEDGDDGEPIPADVLYEWEFKGSKSSESARKDKPDSVVLLTAEQAAKFLGVSRATFWKLYSSGRVPRAVRLSARVVRWLREDLKAWLKNRCRETV